MEIILGFLAFCALGLFYPYGCELFVESMKNTFKTVNEMVFLILYVPIVSISIELLYILVFLCSHSFSKIHMDKVLWLFVVLTIGQYLFLGFIYFLGCRKK